MRNQPLQTPPSFIAYSADVVAVALVIVVAAYVAALGDTFLLGHATGSAKYDAARFWHLVLYHSFVFSFGAAFVYAFVFTQHYKLAPPLLVTALLSGGLLLA